jgi:phosphomannomutase
MRSPLSLKIGLSGVRGVIGESFTPQLVTSFAAAFGTYCGAGPILVGSDTRPTADMVKQAAIAGLLSVGCTPVDAGIVPVPALMFHVRAAGARGAVAVGGSHGSLDWSALRFVDAHGLTLQPYQLAELTDVYHQGVYPRVRADDMSEVVTDATAVAGHLRAVTRAIDVGLVRSARLRVAVDARGGAASLAVLALLEALGCGVVSVHAGPDAVCLPDHEPDETSLAAFGAFVRHAGAHVGFVQDLDADRLFIVDEHGVALGTDATVALVVRRWLEREPGPIVVSVSTSRMVDDVAKRFGCPVFRSPVGEAHVVEAMKSNDAEVGGEGDGGAIVLRVNPCRDSFVALALVLEAMAASGRPMSDLRSQLPRYAMVRERLLCQARDIVPSLRVIRDLFRGEQVDDTDGVKVVWGDRWLLARPSATDRVIRLEAEAPDLAGAQALVNRVLEALSPGA